MLPYNLTKAQYQTFKVFNCPKAASLPNSVLLAVQQMLPTALPNAVTQMQYALQAVHHIYNGNPHGVAYWLLQSNHAAAPSAKQHFAMVLHLYKPAQIAKWQLAAQALLNGKTPLCNNCSCATT